MTITSYSIYGPWDMTTLTDVLTNVLGLTEHETLTGVFYWESDTNNKIGIKFNVAGASSCTIQVWNIENNSLLYNLLGLDPRYCQKFNYSKQGNSLLFGITSSTSPTIPFSSSRINIGIIEPTSQTDDWEYLFSVSNVGYMINGRTKGLTSFQNGQILNANCSVVQLIKAYDQSKSTLTDNVYLTAMSPNTVGTFNDNNNNNYYYIQVGNDTYFCFNNTNQLTGPKYAIKLINENENSPGE